MNLKHLNLDLYGIPENEGMQMAVFLIASDIKSRKLINSLTDIGCHTCFCVSDLSDLTLALIGFDDWSDELYDDYFDLLDQYCGKVSHKNDLPIEEALCIYNKLKSKLQKGLPNGNNAPAAGSTEGFETLKLSAGLKNEIENLINYAHIKRLNRNLRKMLQLYLANEKTGVPLDFDDFMIDLYFLHELLDVVEDEGGRALNAAS
jgi:hypothetical protein